MKINKILIKKISDKKGSVSVETALLVILVFPVILGILVTGFLYSSAQVENVNLNFDTGRFIATSGCNVESAQKLVGYNEWKNYKVTVLINEETSSNVSTEEGGGVIYSPADAKGEIILHCPLNAERGDEFLVVSKIKVIKSLGSQLFPNLTTRSGHYVQELDEAPAITPFGPAGY